jgi:hypothetical protein
MPVGLQVVVSHQRASAYLRNICRTIPLVRSQNHKILSRGQYANCFHNWKILIIEYWYSNKHLLCKKMLLTKRLSVT